MSSTFITFEKLGRYGRAGNQFFQIAGIIGIATHPKNGVDFKFPLWRNYDHLERFGTTEPINIQEYFENPLPLLTEEDRSHIEKETFINWGYHHVLVNGTTSFEGHFQSTKYFDHCMPLVRHYLTMKNEFGPSDYCAVHFRAGDYTDGAHTYHPRQTVDYYIKAMQHFDSSQKYLIFSDDTEIAKAMFGTSPQIAYATGDYLQSFKAMKSCRHFICANSSYSLMAAILANQEGKKMILPKLWFGSAAGGLSTVDLYPENSIVI